MKVLAVPSFVHKEQRVMFTGGVVEGGNQVSLLTHGPFMRAAALVDHHSRPGRMGPVGDPLAHPARRGRIWPQYKAERSFAYPNNNAASACVSRPPRKPSYASSNRIFVTPVETLPSSSHPPLKVKMRPDRSLVPYTTEAAC